MISTTNKNLLFSYEPNPNVGIWGYKINETENGLPVFNGMVGDVATKLYDTSVGGVGLSFERGKVVDFPPPISETRYGLYVRTSLEGEFTLQAYTHEFKVLLLINMICI